MLTLSLINFNRNLCFVPVCGRTHNNPDGLCDTSLLADNSAHIAGSDMKVVNNDAFFIRFVNIDRNLRRFIDQSLYNGY